MTENPLGTLEPVDIRLQWPDEAQDFTPWLASEVGLALLGKAIGTGWGLATMAQEKPVGPFRADILARYQEDDEDKYVVIENQYGKTNHDHLGKVITYGAGLEAVAVVWIAENFTDEHRQALDWLNENARENLGFFGLEIQLWRIGNSVPAPQFKVVSSPNEWVKTIRQPPDAVTDEKLDQLSFWKDLHDHALAQKSKLNWHEPQPKSNYWLRVGKAGFNIALAIQPGHQRVQCKFIIQNTESHLTFAQLQSQQSAIEQEIGQQLDWQRPEGVRRLSVVANRLDTLIDNPMQRAEAIIWLYTMAEKFARTFVPRVKSSSALDDGDEELPD